MKEESQKAAKRFNLTLPKFTFKETPMNGFLVMSLVIFAFLLGMLTNKVVYLEQQLKNPTNLAAQGTQPTAPTPPVFVEDLSPGKLPLLGNKDAKVTLVEFSDFQCPFCKAYFDDTHAQIKEKYVDTGKVKFAFRHFPLTSIHPLAQKAAEASECASEQGKFWEYHDLLFIEQDSWSQLADEEGTNSFVDFAGQVGINSSQFSSCLESEKYKTRVEEDIAGATDAQVEATPTYIVNGTRVVGALPFAEL
jgi:protein-disulfide isomerase